MILWIEGQTHAGVSVEQGYFAATAEQTGCGKTTAVSRHRELKAALFRWQEEMKKGLLAIR